MKAVQCHAYGPPETLQLDEIEAPTPKAGEVCVRVRAAALNFPDVLMIQGKYQSQPPFPFTPGGEFAGDVHSVGAEVEGFKVGDRVFGGTGVGTLAEQLCAPAATLRRIPKGMSYAQASGISTTYGTSYYALSSARSLSPGKRYWVTGAGGGVGLAAVELGKAMGANVIAAASSADKLAAAKAAGADELINYSSDSLKEQVKALTKGRGADVIYDPVGGELFDQCMRSIAWYGRVLVIGFAAGEIPKLPINLVLLKSCQVVGVFFGAWSARAADEARLNFQEILALYEQGKLNPLVGAEYPLAEHAAAMRCLMDRKAIGKVVVTMEA